MDQCIVMRPEFCIESIHFLRHPVSKTQCGRIVSLRFLGFRFLGCRFLFFLGYFIF